MHERRWRGDACAERRAPRDDECAKRRELHETVPMRRCIRRGYQSNAACGEREVGNGVGARLRCCVCCRSVVVCGSLCGSLPFVDCVLHFVLAWAYEIKAHRCNIGLGGVYWVYLVARDISGLQIRLYAAVLYGWQLLSKWRKTHERGQEGPLYLCSHERPGARRHYVGCAMCGTGMWGMWRVVGHKGNRGVVVIAPGVLRLCV